MVHKLKQILPLPIKRLIKFFIHIPKKTLHVILGFFHISWVPGYIPTYTFDTELDTNNSFFELKQKYNAYEFLINRLKKEPAPQRRSYSELENITVYGNQGFIKKDKYFILDHLMHPVHIYSPKNSSILMWQNEWIIPKPKKILDSAFVMISLFSHNYYHYLLDTLTKFDNEFIYPEITDIVMVEPFYQFQKQSLQFLNTKYRLHFVSKNHTIQIKKAWVPIAKYHTEFPPLSKIQFLRNLFSHNANVPSPKYVYLTRKTARNERKIMQEKMFIEFLETYGFETIDFTNQSLMYQHTVLRDSKVIVSPHGAALTNIIFTDKHPTIIEIFHQNDPNSHYFNIAQHLNLNYEYYVDDTISKKARPNIHVNLDRFKPQLERILKEAT